MNWEITFSVFIALAAVLAIFTLDLKRHRKEANKLLRTTLADYQDYVRQLEGYKKERVLAQEEYGHTRMYFAAIHSIDAMQCETRQTFTGQDLATKIAEHQSRAKELVEQAKREPDETHSVSSANQEPRK